VIKQDILENQAKVVYLSIGSNLGNRNLNLEKTKFKLLNYKINIIKCSKKYETLSWPNPKNPKFLNLVLKVKTYLSCNELLKVCLSIENEMGRKRLKKNEPRTCDIDIIDYNQEVISVEKQKLFVPHRSMHKRNFVLLPLHEISKSWIHPKKKVNIINLLNYLTITDLRTIKQI